MASGRVCRKPTAHPSVWPSALAGGAGRWGSVSLGDGRVLLAALALTTLPLAAACGTDRATQSPAHTPIPEEHAEIASPEPSSLPPPAVEYLAAGPPAPSPLRSVTAQRTQRFIERGEVVEERRPVIRHVRWLGRIDDLVRISVEEEHRRWELEADREVVRMRLPASDPDARWVPILRGAFGDDLAVLFEGELRDASGTVWRVRSVQRAPSPGVGGAAQGTRCAEAHITEARALAQVMVDPSAHRPHDAIVPIRRETTLRFCARRGIEWYRETALLPTGAIAIRTVERPTSSGAR